MHTPTPDQVKAYFQEKADRLIKEAEAAGYVIRINCEPLQPLKMGNSKMAAHVEPKFKRN